MTRELCECGHLYDEHDPPGRCRALDSYGIRCTCHSPVPHTGDDDPDEAEREAYSDEVW